MSDFFYAKCLKEEKMLRTDPDNILLESLFNQFV